MELIEYAIFTFAISNLQRKGHEMSGNTIIIKKYGAESEKGRSYTFKPSDHAQKYMKS